MSVYSLEKEMPYTELLKWLEFFRRRPVGWREDHRTSMLMNAAGVKEPGHKMFQSLLAIKERAEMVLVDDKALPKGRLLEMMLTAKGGDGSGWSPSAEGLNK